MKAWGVSHVGMARKVNEDAFLISMSSDAQSGYFIVCDGMGGAKAGDVASRLATDTFAAQLHPSIACAKPEECVQNAMQAANTRVWEMSRSDPALEGMGTTMVCLLVQDGDAVIGNVGDSRAYLIDEEGISQITKDHSLVGEMIVRGELTPFEAQRHPSRNVITRAIGADKSIRCDTFPIRPRPGQYILLCSDGLTGEVSEPEIYYEVYQSEAPEKACQTLVEIANDRGGRDNITVVLVAF